jgi:cellulose 1,4-beta-cellobiosidase
MKRKGILFFAVILTALMLSGCPGVGTAPEKTSGTPAAPQGVSVTAENGRLVVIWQPVTGADKYDVKWKKSGEESSNMRENISGTSYTISGLENDTTYSIQVQAKNGGGASEWSKPAEGTLEEPKNVPKTPSQPTVTSNGDTLTVTWDTVPDATKYQVFCGASPNPTSQYGGDISGASVEIPVSESGTYYVRITAGNGKGYSAFSPDGFASVTVSGTPSVIGSWKDDRYTYTFAENGQKTAIRW